MPSSFRFDIGLMKAFMPTTRLEMSLPKVGCLTWQTVSGGHGVQVSRASFLWERNSVIFSVVVLGYDYDTAQKVVVSMIESNT